MGESRKKRAVLIGSASGSIPSGLAERIRPDDFIICADGGRELAEQLGLRPDWYVGDNDSGGRPEGLPATLLPSEKDVSDMEMAVDQALQLGYRELLLMGCAGGRGDHHLANLGLLEQIDQRGGHGILLDRTNEVRFLGPGSYQIENRPKYHYLGLIPLDATVTGVTLTGVRYPLDDFTLRRGSTRSISNEILPGNTAGITIRDGHVYLIRSQPEPIDPCEKEKMK
ncbi:MAG: thiamine diphosphokinase [Clostridiales bacterium]|nr:thiamine diphosphokinase [Clostridiales bacterium]